MRCRNDGRFRQTEIPRAGDGQQEPDGQSHRHRNRIAATFEACNRPAMEAKQAPKIHLVNAQNSTRRQQVTCRKALQISQSRQMQHFMYPIDLYGVSGMPAIFHYTVSHNVTIEIKRVQSLRKWEAMEWVN
ncbi:hypothetical protein EAN25_25055 [Salmonella enterica]|nr:hypothetical protein [Salmonella enterica]